MPARRRAAPPTEHVPHRGSDVEAWLKRMRDQFHENTPEEWAADVILERYREMSDYGLTLRPEDDRRGDP